jgi:hypothetical protein
MEGMWQHVRPGSSPRSCHFEKTQKKTVRVVLSIKKTYDKNSICGAEPFVKKVKKKVGWLGSVSPAVLFFFL